MSFLHMSAEIPPPDKEMSWTDQQSQQVENDSPLDMFNVTMEASAEKNKVSSCQPEVR
jgi:hypothetical protein